MSAESDLAAASIWDFAHARPATARDQVDGHSPRLVIRPETEAELSAAVTLAHQAGWALVPRGGGTQLSIGNLPARLHAILDLGAFTGIVDHAVPDLTLTVRAGTPLGAVRAYLAPFQQILPLEAPIDDLATVGGVVATATSGPLRQKYGTPRDLLIGARAILADGTVVKGGGRVVKNVAGYDLCKLFTGSHGTLAILSELTLRLYPAPEASGTLAAGYSDLAAFEAARDRLCASGLPWSILDGVDRELACRLGDRGAWDLPTEHVVIVGAEGAAPDVNALLAKGHELLAPDSRFVRHLDADHQIGLRGLLCETSLLPGAALSFRVAMPVTQLAAYLALTERLGRLHNGTFGSLVRLGQGVAYSHYHPFEPQGDLAPLVTAMAKACMERKIQLILHHAPLPVKRAFDVWNPGQGRTAGPLVPSPQTRLRMALKRDLDPLGGLSPGRGPGWV